MEHAVALMVAIIALVMGLSLIFRPNDWLAWMKSLYAQGTSASMMMGYMHLVFGAFIVAFHWKWNGLPLLLTLLGVKAIAEGVVYTLFPKTMTAMLGWYIPHHRMLLPFAGIIALILGGLVFCEWWDYMQNFCTWKPCYDQARL